MAKTLYPIADYIGFFHNCATQLGKLSNFISNTLKTIANWDEFPSYPDYNSLISSINSLIDTAPYKGQLASDFFLKNADTPILVRVGDEMFIGFSNPTAIAVVANILAQNRSVYCVSENPECKCYVARITDSAVYMPFTGHCVKWGLNIQDKNWSDISDYIDNLIATYTFYKLDEKSPNCNVCAWNNITDPRFSVASSVFEFFQNFSDAYLDSINVDETSTFCSSEDVLFVDGCEASDKPTALNPKPMLGFVSKMDSPWTVTIVPHWRDLNYCIDVCKLLVSLDNYFRFRYLTSDSSTSILSYPREVCTCVPGTGTSCADCTVETVNREFDTTRNYISCVRMCITNSSNSSPTISKAVVQYDSRSVTCFCWMNDKSCELVGVSLFQSLCFTKDFDCESFSKVTTLNTNIYNFITMDYSIAVVAKLDKYTEGDGDFPIPSLCVNSLPRIYTAITNFISSILDLSNLVTSDRLQLKDGDRFMNDSSSLSTTQSNDFPANIYLYDFSPLSGVVIKNTSNQTFSLRRQYGRYKEDSNGYSGIYPPLPTCNQDSNCNCTPVFPDHPTDWDLISDLTLILEPTGCVLQEIDLSAENRLTILGPQTN